MKKLFLFLFFLQLNTQAAFMEQTWSHLFFVHYEVEVSELQKLVPAPLEIDTFEGRGYLGIVSLEMTRAKTALGKIPLILKPFAQINVRTYVKYKEKRGVYFLSIDAPHLLTILGAKTIFSLPYEKAETKFEALGEENFSYVSANSKRIFSLEAQVQESIFQTKVGELLHFLTHRDSSLHFKNSCLYFTSLSKKAWKLQEAEGHLNHGLSHITKSKEPISFLYSQGTKVLFDAPKKISCF